MKLIITKEVEVTHQNIDDLMITAFEGGISYWCSNAKLVCNGACQLTWLKDNGSKRTTAEMLSQGYDIELHDSEAGETYLLTIEKFITGLTRWLSEGGDLDNFDADDADRIVQYALFNELVYG